MTAPTLTWLDSFWHSVASAVFYGSNAGIYDTVTGATRQSYVTGRRSNSLALQIAQDGATASRVIKTIAAGNRVLVESFYFKASAIPTVQSNMWVATAFISANVGINQTTGFFTWNAGNNGSNSNSTNMCDGLWHRVDLRWTTSGTIYTMEIMLDGVGLTTHSSNSTTAADITDSRIGSANAAHTLTYAITDQVRSVTTGDYPIGPHIVDALVPVADGTHNWASTNMGPLGGGVASTVSTLWTNVDEWPASAVDGIQYANLTATSSEYAEILMQDIPTGNAIWAARAIAAIMSASTPANSATTRVVDAANATKLDLYVGDQSDTTMRWQAGMIPGVTDVGILNGLKWRVGFPTDSNPQPEWMALMIDYAAPEPSYERTRLEPLPFMPLGRSM